MNRTTAKFETLLSPRRILFRVMTAVFLAELVVMFVLLRYLHIQGSLTWTLLDSTALSLLLAPFLWWWLIRPLRSAAMRETMLAANIINTSVDAIITIDDRGRITAFNPAAEQLFGYGKKEAIGRNIKILMPPPEREQHDAYIERYLKTGEGKIIGVGREVIAQRKDGVTFPIYLSVSEGREGDRPIFTGIAQDLTERKRSERERQAISDIIQGVSTTRDLPDLLELIHESISKVLYAENCFVALCDEEQGTLTMQFFVDKCDPMPPPHSMGKSCAAYVFLNNRPLLITQKIFDELAAAGQVKLMGTQSPSWLGVPLVTPSSTIGVLVVQHYEDEQAYSERDLEFLTSVGGQIAMAIERKVADNELHESERRLRLATESSNTGLWDWDLRTNAVWYSREWKHQIGYEEDEISNEFDEWKSRVHPDDREAATKAVTAYLKDPQPNYENEFRFRHKDGSYRWILARASLVKDAEGTPVRMLGSHVDITERRISEEALRKSEENYRDLVENSLELITTQALDGQILSANRAAAKTLGYEGEDYAGKTNLRDILAPEVRDQLDEYLARIRRDGVASGLMLVQTRTGEKRIWEYYNTLRTEGVGTPIVRSMARDITERKRTEEALRESEERYRDLVENAQDIIYSHDLKGNYTSSNKASERITGYSQAEALKLNFATTIAPEYLDQTREMMSRKLAGEEVTAYQLELIAKDGHRIPVEVNTRLVVRDGIPVGVQGIARDITERRKAEAELRRLAAAVEQTADSVVITDLDGIIQYVNPAFERITGYAKEDVVNQNPRILKSDKTSPSVYRELWDTITRGKVWSGRLTNRKKDGTLFEERVTISPIQNESGRIVNYVAVKQDVTHQTQLEEQLRQSQKMEAIGQLAGGVAHDFNNLLTAINGYSSLALQRMDESNPIIKGYLEEIKKAGDRAANLTRQLLAFGRKQILQPLPINLNDVVTDMNNMLKRLIGEDIVLTAKLDPALRMIKADPGQIEQVLVNLVVNARDAMPQGGTLTIETGMIELDSEYAGKRVGVVPGRYVMLAISDTGIGMSEATRARIFDPFFTTKEKGKGTGLGLSTVYGIIKQSGGDVWVYSEPDHGTTFKVYLPQLETVARPETQVIETKSPRGSETILLLEDEDMVRDLTRQVLEGAGYKVIEASRGEDAIKLCRAHNGSIDLLLTDVVMPQMSGKEVADQVSARVPGLKVLFMSGYTDEAIVHHGVLDVNIEFIQKPFTPVALAKKVRAVLDAVSVATE